MKDKDNPGSVDAQLIFQYLIIFAPFIATVSLRKIPVSNNKNNHEAEHISSSVQASWFDK